MNWYVQRIKIIREIYPSESLLSSTAPCRWPLGVLRNPGRTFCRSSPFPSQKGMSADCRCSRLGVRRRCRPEWWKFWRAGRLAFVWRGWWTYQFPLVCFAASSVSFSATFSPSSHRAAYSKIDSRQMQHPVESALAFYPCYTDSLRPCIFPIFHQ